ncbi:MAG: RHS repeat-associated core domain-containing protein [Pantoea sp.]|uniref:RHS repeat-associated core domain-containing protein n=1 Tax=Pantoea sp. TaxID=69393 RepID=UPI0039E548D5
MKEASALNNSYERYRYVCAGQRVTKATCQPIKQGMHQQQVRYLTGLELRTTNMTSQMNEDLRVITLKGVRILHWQRGKPEGVDIYQPRFSVADRSENIRFELDGEGNIISREHYYPFGGTSLWATARQITSHYKTLRYAAKERDITGLLYNRYRYYAPWMMRWINTDPAGGVDGINLFRMVKNNPVTFTDEDGRITVNKEEMMGAGFAIYALAGAAWVSGSELENFEFCSAILGSVVVGLSFVLDSVFKYSQQQDEKKKKTEELNNEINALGKLAEGYLGEFHPIETEDYRMRDITVVGKNDNQYPAITYTLRDEKRKLYFSSHGEVSGKGQPVINGMNYSPDDFYEYLKRFHQNFDADYDTLVVTCCNTPDGAKKFGEELRDITGKNIITYSGLYSSVNKYKNSIMEKASTRLSAGQSPSLVTRYLRDEESKGILIYRRMNGDRSKFLRFESNVKELGRH